MVEVRRFLIVVASILLIVMAGTVWLVYLYPPYSCQFESCGSAYHMPTRAERVGSAGAVALFFLIDLAVGAIVIGIVTWDLKRRGLLPADVKENA